MIKGISVLFIIFFSVRILPSDENYIIKYSKYIPVNSPFEISISTSNKFGSADELMMNIVVDNYTNINSVFVRSGKFSKNVPFVLIKNESELKSFTVKINLNDSIFSSLDFFQILFNFQSENSSESQIKFEAEYHKNGKLVDELFKSNLENKNEASVHVTFYQPQTAAGKCLELPLNSEFIIDVRKDSIKNFLLQFWFKDQSANPQFLKVKDRISNKTLFEIGVNNFQMLELLSNGHSTELSNVFFISRKSWNNLTVHFSLDEKKIFFYCNSILFAKQNLPPEYNSESTEIKFFNSAASSSVQIEQLRLIDYRKHQIKSALIYSLTKEVSLDSLNMLLQLDFDENVDKLISNKYISVRSQNVRNVFSDAPLLPLSPEVKVNVASHYNDIQWQGGDFKTVKKYILERSTSDSPFSEISTVEADKENDKIYSFIDEREANTGITYYRIKILKEDGSTFISNQIKIGQGEEESFNLIQNYPNPFNPKTSIAVNLFIDSDLNISVYNLEGKLVQIIFDGFLEKGDYKFDFDASELSSGIYLYKVSTPVSSQVKKMLLTK